MRGNSLNLKNMIEKSLFLHERMQMAGPFTVNDTNVHRSEEMERYLQIWQRKAGGNGGEQAFLKRLAADGLTVEQAARIFAPVDWQPNAPSPDWLNAIEKMLSFLPMTAADVKKKVYGKRWHDYTNPNNVTAALLPFLNYAEQVLFDHLGIGRNWLAETAIADMIFALAKSLNQLCFRTCLHEFQKDMHAANPLFNLLGHLISPTENLAAWRRHNEQLLQGKWREVFAAYPVLARLVVVVISNWLDHMLEFVGHLSADFSKLEATFGRTRPLGILIHIEANLSDVHNKGKGVIICEFASGIKTVYKPRSLDIDAAWEQWIAYMTQSGMPLTLKTPKLVNGKQHGWAEFINHKPLVRQREAKDFYFRAGVLLGTAYIFGGSDFHYENLIACGAHPVLIDLETLMAPRVNPFHLEEEAGVTARQKTLDLLSDSVLRTGMLPLWRVNAKGVAIDSGALTSNSGNRHNLPIWQGEPLKVNDYADQLLAGVEWVYDFVLSRQQQMLAEHSPLQMFKSCHFRFLIRNSQVYGDMLQHTTHPDYLADGVLYSLEIERIAVAYLLQDGAHHFDHLWNIFASEREALERRDIPIFYGEAEALSLGDATQTRHPYYFAESAYDRAKRLIGRLSRRDKSIQLDFIQTALSMYKDTAHVGSHISSEKAKPGRKVTLTDDMLLREATFIFETIMNKRINSTDDDFTWIVRQFDMRTQKMTLGQIGIGFYDGLIGLTVFMSALYRITNKEEIRQTAYAALKSFRKALHASFNPLPISRMPLGLGDGLAGILRGLITVGQYLEDDTFIADAHTVAQRITAEQINGDKALDVLGGSAGLILGLLDLYAIDHDGQVLALAIQCGEHLLHKRIVFDSEHHVWATGIGTAPLTGMGHGVAGFAHALYLLGALAKRSDFQAAALEAVAYENALYSDEHVNWPDLRKNPFHDKQHEPAFMAGWCSGAPGIGLARIGMLNAGGQQAEQNNIIRKDIERAVQFTRKTSLVHSDHICCGHAGRIDFMLAASAAQDQPEYVDWARQTMGAIIARKQKNGHYLLNGNDAGAVFNPSFFQGISGIGYEMLRCIAPQKIKSLFM